MSPFDAFTLLFGRGALIAYAGLSFVAKASSRRSISTRIIQTRMITCTVLEVTLLSVFDTLPSICDRIWENPAYSEFYDFLVSYIFDKLYHRANPRSSFRATVRFVVEIQRFVCDRAAPPIIEKLRSKCVAMHVYGVSAYCA